MGWEGLTKSVDSSQANTPWWKRTVEFGPKFCSEEVSRAIQFNAVVQFIVVFLMGGTFLDGGTTAYMLAVAAAFYWIAAAPILLRRRFTARGGELIFLRSGYVIFIPVSLLTMPLWGWLLELFK